MPIDSPGQLFTRSRTVVSRVVAGETLIVPVRGKVGDLASIYSFNGTGSLIWQILDSPRSLVDLIDAVEREYAVDLETATKDVTQFVTDLHSVGLLDVRAAVHAVVATESAEMNSIDMGATDSTQQILQTAGSR
jgi:hypothetical protein